MVADVGADLKEKADGELAHVVRAVNRDVQDRDALFLRVLVIRDVVAGGQNGDRLQVRAGVDGRLADGGLVDDRHFRVADPLRDQRGLLIGSSVINRNLAKCLKGRPADVSGVLSVSVKNNNLHGLFLLRFSVFSVSPPASPMPCSGSAWCSQEQSSRPRPWWAGLPWREPAAPRR